MGCLWEAKSESVPVLLELTIWWARGTLISKSTNKYKLQWWSSDDIIGRVSLCWGSGRAVQGE